MSGKVLYRKYRPTKLADVVGQSQVTDALQNRITQGNLGHAYLFIGPRGTGKTSVARIFAHAVNDFDYQVEDNYLDIIEIDAASNTGVDNIRELREKAVIAPTKGKYKVYIIDEVHMLTKSASNALLKTLEEPPEHVIFIMATTDAHKVPITISSRTQVFTFRLADPDTMFQHLRKISDLEHIPIDDDALRLIVRRGGGSFRDSLSLLDQVTTLTHDNITVDLLVRALGLPQDQSITDLLNSYTTGNAAAVQQALKDLLNTGIKPEIIASELIEHIIAQPQPAWLPLLEKLPDVQPPFPEARLLVALMSKVPTNFAPVAPNLTPVSTSTPVEIIKSASITSNSNTSTPVEIMNPTTPDTSSSTAPAPSNISTPVDPTIDDTPIEPAEPTSDIPVPSEHPDTEFTENTPKDNTIHIPRTSATATLSQKNTNPLAASADDAPMLAPQPPSDPSKFDWQNFLDATRRESGAVYQQLLKTEYELIGDTLHLYPLNKFAHTILNKPNHNQILRSCLGSLALNLHEFGPKAPPKDPALSKISDIMGAGIQEVTGDLPF